MWLPSLRNFLSPVTRRDRAGRPRRPRRLWLEPLEDRCLLAATLLDINTDGAHSSPGGFAAVGDRVFFIANGPGTGRELWVTDGTPEGTRLVRDINPGSAGSDPRSLTAVGDRVFFRATAPGTGRELWVSDGTAKGTRLVRDIAPGAASTFVEAVDTPSLTAVGGQVFFPASVPVTGLELWVSDGTEEGTRLVRDINPGSNPSIPQSLTALGDRLFFTAVTSGASGTGRELWVSDGTAKGTRLVRDINPGSASGFSPAGTGNLVGVGSRLFFTAFTPATGVELWVSDGTEKGTRLVRDINPGSASTYGLADTGSFAAVGDRLFFTAATPAAGRELWVSDGTEKGTYLILDINPGPSSSVGSGLTAVGGRLFFRAFTPGTGDELWVSDGTAKGTRLVRDILPGTGTSFPSSFTAAGDRLFFTATVPASGWELWVSDGTEKGTRLVHDINPGAADSFPSGLTAVGDRLFFSALTPAAGHELWVSDGTAAGTRLIQDIHPGTITSDPGPLTAVGDRLFFTAFTGETGRELWVSDGTVGGTRLVKDINPGSAFTFGPPATASLTAVGDRLFFVAPFAPGLGAELWVSDGTAEGTRLVRDLIPGPTSAFLGDLTAVGDRLFFTADVPGTGRELWVSDGTEKGTRLVRDVNPGSAGSNPQRLTAVGDRLFFTAESPAAGSGLWVSDGTAAGTRLVRDFGGPDVFRLTAVGGRLFFIATGELWVSDGTPEGTRSIGPGASELRAVGDRLFFTTYDSLWVSDGTTEGTSLIREFVPVADEGPPFLGTPVGDRLFFTADVSGIGRELWVSDGTTAGTHLVRDIVPGPLDSSPSGLTAVGDRLFFTADIAGIGRELWVSDGTAAGTFLVQDLNPGSASAGPDLRAVNGLLYFAADDGVHGRELWVLPGTVEPPPNQPPVLSPILDRLIGEGSPLSFMVTATDPNPGDTLTFSLVSGPAGASIDPVTGTFTWTPDDGPATVTVTVRVTDSGDPALSDTRSFTVIVLNVAPSPGISGPTSGTPGQTLTFTLSATDPSALDQAAGFTYRIDWGDGTPLQTIDAFPGSGSGVAVSHAYAAVGAYVVRVSAIDRDGGTGTALLTEPVMIATVPTGVSDLSWSGGGILAPPPVAAGQAFTIGRTFAVGGEPVGPFTIAYWASVDDIFGNEDDFLVGVEFFSGAAPGIHSGVSPAFTIGAAGTYYLFGVLDSLGEVAEINEDNNLVRALATLLVTDPDDDE